MSRWFAALLGLSLCLLAGMPVRAQTPTPVSISLDSPVVELQTGQAYDINIRLDNATEVWLVNAEIAYDPSLMYVIGTQSGQPLSQGALFDPNQSIIVRNLVRADQIIYTLSMLAPAKSVSGSGIVGTFRVYPLAPGDTQLSFTRVTLNKVTQVVENGTSVSTQIEALPFVPIMIQLRITGNRVPIPSEATATPAPTETPFFVESELPTREPTLVNVTAVPRPTISPTDTAVVSDMWSNQTLLLIAISVVILSGLGLVVLWVVYRRGRG